MQNLGLEKTSAISPMVIVAAVVALFVVIGGSILLINDGPTPAELAAAESASTTEFVPPELGAWYCRNPVARPEAPAPSEAVNQFLVFEYANAERTTSPLDIYSTADPSSAAYALCLTGVENGEDVECVGYSDNRTFRFEAMDWSASLIQLSTGEEVFASDVLRGPDPECPSIITENLGIIRADLDNLRYATVPWAFPNEFSERHLGNQLNANSGTWCDSPTPLTQLGTDRIEAVSTTEPPTSEPGDDAELEPALELAGTPPEVYISGEPAARTAVGELLSVDSIDLDMISHVACVVSEWPRGRDWPRCDYNDFALAFRPYTYRVTVVDVMTGESIASESFLGETVCPDSLITRTSTEIRNAVVPDAVGSFIESAVGAEAFSD